jgi:aspartate/tyrosine/aromatic aminotransferase
MARTVSLIEDAHSAFVAKDYTKALFLFGHLNSIDPLNEEYKLYATLCDIASENELKAQALYDFFIISKANIPKQALEATYDLIKAYDGDQEQIMSLLKDITTQAVESLEAIHYKDFMQLVRDRGSFRVAFEDIMFSAKIALDTKEELFDFVDKLIENGFNTIAYSYLDDFNQFFSYDNHIKELYKKIEENRVENNNR